MTRFDVTISWRDREGKFYARVENFTDYAAAAIARSRALQGLDLPLGALDIDVVFTERSFEGDAA